MLLSILSSPFFLIFYIIIEKKSSVFEKKSKKLDKISIKALTLEKKSSII
jgi:hypothetical protein